ncbi:short chain dehydrogenase [compost metagenome]
MTGQVFESQGGRISLGDGWRTGITQDKGGRWQVQEIGSAVAQILAQAPAPQKVWGS